MLLSHHYLPFVLLAALISSACAAPTPPPSQKVPEFIIDDSRQPLPPMYDVDVLNQDLSSTRPDVPSAMHTRIGEFIMNLDRELDPNTHNDRDWKSKVIFDGSSYSPETKDDPKKIAYFRLSGPRGTGALCSGWSSCIGYVVEIEGHLPGTTVAVGAVVVQTKTEEKPWSETYRYTYTALDHIPPSENGHAATLQKHQQEFRHFMETGIRKMKEWQEHMTRENFKIPERLGWTLPLANGATSPSHAASGAAPASPGKPPHPHPGPHSR
ncbi:hypothetical protein BDP27DRAFT_1436686 [Rhodocollybia butyracea]|uniref:Uncharacterized protein n=1 Tax=Rhodocollybia butyracea TaxID=206335 RepID=A0A9P5P115_9AGAR|nr:hypothetical protein BDP27DRAFT_1436686 [Rhodocollybia butyracea]